MLTDFPTSRPGFKSQLYLQSWVTLGRSISSEHLLLIGQRVTSIVLRIIMRGLAETVYVKLLAGAPHSVCVH